jgi:hypothetical protein
VCRYLDSIQSKVTDEIACEKQCSFNEDFICRSFAFYTSGSFDYFSQQQMLLPVGGLLAG